MFAICLYLRSKYSILSREVTAKIIFTLLFQFRCQAAECFLRLSMCVCLSLPGFTLITIKKHLSWSNIDFAKTIALDSLSLFRPVHISKNVMRNPLFVCVTFELHNWKRLHGIVSKALDIFFFKRSRTNSIAVIKQIEMIANGGNGIFSFPSWYSQFGWQAVRWLTTKTHWTLLHFV